MKPIQLISPVDGSVFAERVPLSHEAATAAVGKAKAAQKPWAARPLEERITLVKAGVTKLNAMKDVVVEETAWQMGRPTRFGGEFGGVNARTEYMSDIAAATLAPQMVEDSDKFRRYIAREALGVVFIVAPWNYPYLTTINTLVPASILPINDYWLRQLFPFALYMQIASLNFREILKGLQQLNIYEFPQLHQVYVAI